MNLANLTSMIMSRTTGALPVVFALTLCCLLLYIFPTYDKLAYQRDLILAGEFWRLFTGNLLHTNLWHLGMNLAGLWVIFSLHHMHYRFWGLLLLISFLCIAEGLGLLAFYPQLIGYVGLSGILHGLFAFGVVLDIKAGVKFGLLLLGGIIAKVLYEQIIGANQDVAALIGARVATESHFVGLLVGLMFGVLWLSFKPKSNH